MSATLSQRPTGYDPFGSGPSEVSVLSGELVDRSRDGRRLPYAVWRPAEPIEKLPLIVFSHTSGGHRLQSSLLCAHLASHGYVVAAADHTGNTETDVKERAARGAASRPLNADEIDALVARFIADRVPDIRFVIDEVGGGDAAIDDKRLGLIGYSFGGWAVLAVPEVDDRVSAIVAMAPAGNSKPLPGIIPATLTFAWRREVSTLFLVAERDRFTPLPGQYELLERAPSPKRMFILRGADHQHFGDVIDPEDGCPTEAAHLFTRALALAHMDAVLKKSAAAETFLAGDTLAALHERGVEARR